MHSRNLHLLTSVILQKRSAYTLNLISAAPPDRKQRLGRQMMMNRPLQKIAADFWGKVVNEIILMNMRLSDDFVFCLSSS